MAIFQEAVAFTTGMNFTPVRMRLRLPERKKDTTIFLLSDSYEYDLQMIKNAPPPKIDYKTLVIPFRLIDKIGTRPFRFIKTQNEYTRQIVYLNELKLNPRLIPIRYPYPNRIEDNVFVPMSELVHAFTPYLRQLPVRYIKDNVFTLFEKLIKSFHFSSMRVLMIDTEKFPIYRNPTIDVFKTDIINAIIAAYYLLPPNQLRKINMILWFKTPDADYKFDLSNFDKQEISRMRKMLMDIGRPLESGLEGIADRESNEIVDDVVGDNIDIDEIFEKKSEVVDGIEDTLDDSENDNPETITSTTDDIRASVDALKTKFAGVIQNNDNKPNDSNKKLRQAKELNIQAELLKRISIDTGIVGNYKTIADDMRTNADTPVEDKLIDDASKRIASIATAANIQNAMNTTSSAREQKMRDRIGRLKLGNVTFNTLTSVTDVPKPAPIVPLHITTTNPGSMKSTSFTNISKAYEENLMDRDIVQTFMNLANLPDGFEVTNIEVRDISTILSLQYDWKVSLKSKLTGRQNVIHIRVPKVNNGKFYDNGIWYNIGKQDFPIPILKLKPNRVMLTSNYQKITVERYDTKSLVDLGILVKVLTKIMDDSGSNKYVRTGSSLASNSKFTSTIEFDEYAKRWYCFINKEANLEIYFNRVQCAKLYGFVHVDADEFCCGMINQVPIVLNTETGLTRNGKSLTDIMVESLPPDIRNQYQKTKPGKRSMYTQMNATIWTPVGVTCCAWEGLSSVLKKGNVEHKIIDSVDTNSMTGYFFIQFKDKTLAIRNTIQNQLLFNGFYLINTKSYNMADFEIPIMNMNSVYVDIYNQHFFKQYSQLTTFIAYYNFFVDAITSDVCLHYNIPNDIVSMLIYGSNLLADNGCTNENTSSFYRIRSTEVIPAIIHEQIAIAISRYKNKSASKSRDNSLEFNPNCVFLELEKLATTETASALNPMIELHQKETITQKGFHGVNKARAYNLVKRTYDPTMIGKMAMSSSNNANVSINRQLVADPKIESVRGYTSTDGVDAKYNDLQLASFSELLTPGTVSHDDAIRTTIATSQTSHIVSTAVAEPCLISNGVDEIVSSCVSDEFSIIAEQDGKVLEITDGYMIIQYKNQKKRAINIEDRYSSNPASGFYVNNKLQANFEQGQTFKKGDVLAYHEKFFTKCTDGVVRMNIGPLAKVAFAGLYSTYEDAGIMTESFSKKLATSITMMQHNTLDATDNIESIVKVGDEVEIGDPLIVFGLGDTGDKSVDNFLKAFQTDTGNAIDNAKRIIKSKHIGRVVDVRMYTTKSLDKLSPSLYKLFDAYFKENIKKRKILDKHDKSSSVYKLDTLYTLPTGPVSGQVIKGFTCDVLIEIYIEHEDLQSVGDKLVAYAASKQVISEVVPVGQEPYAASTPDEEISVIVSDASVTKRMIPSVMVTAAGNKVLIELKKKIKQIWENK